MGWEEDLFALFDDLEQQAEGMFHADRDLEIADRSQSEYTRVTLASRLMASVDSEVVLGVRGLGVLRGELQRVSAEWCLLAGRAGPSRTEFIVPFSAVDTVRGASDRSLPEAAWSPVTRLGLGSALRRLGQARERCQVHLVSGERLECRVQRVGKDFVELAVGENRSALVSFGGIAAVQNWE